MLSLLVFALQAQAVSCQDRYVDWRGPRSLCHEWAANASPLLESFSENGVRYDIPNPSVIDRGELPAVIARLTLKANVNENQTDAMNEQFESLKRTMISQETNDVPETKLDEHQRYLKQRIERTHLKVLAEAHETCQPPTQFNARFDAHTNQVSVCPLTTHLPVQAWLPLVSHELGHLADPCTYTQDYAFTGRMPEARENIALTVETCLKSGANRPSKETLGRWVNEVVLPSHVRDRFIDSNLDRAAIDRLKECGLLAETGDPAPPARDVKPSVAECESGQENKADQFGYKLLSLHMRKNPTLFKAHANLVSYFYGTTNCAAAEHAAGDGTYASSGERMANFLNVPEVRALVNCGGQLR